MDNKFKADIYTVVEEGREIEKIRIQHAEVLNGGFRDFMGTPNSKGTIIRSFCVSVPDDVVSELEENDIPVSEWAPKEDPEASKINIVKFKINYDYSKTPTIYTKEGDNGEPVETRKEALHLLQGSRFTDSYVTARITHGVYMNKPYTSLYVDTACFTKRTTEEDAYEKDMLAAFGIKDEPEELPFS